MVEKIKPTDEIFKRAVARGDRAQIERWDRDGMVAWHPLNSVGRQLSEEAQRRKAEQESNAEPKKEPDRSRLDQLGVGVSERLTSHHPLVQSAIRRGDGALLGELFSDPRYEAASGTGPQGAFTWADLEARNRQDAS